MHDPFQNRRASLAGPANDLLPITPSDTEDLPLVCTALYVENGGSLSIITQAGQSRTLSIGDQAILPVGVRRVEASGTSASGIHGFVVE